MATHIGLQLVSHVSLYQVLWQLILAILACDAEKAFAIIEQRMASLHHGAGDLSDVILDLDESSCFLDKDEKKDVEDAQRDSCAAAASLQAFRSEFRRHRAETRAAAPAPKAAGKRAKPSAAAPRFGKYPALPMTMLTQPEAKALLPPLLVGQSGAGSATALGTCACPPSNAAPLHGASTGHRKQRSCACVSLGRSTSKARASQLRHAQ